MSDDPDFSFVTEDKLRLILRAELADFKLYITHTLTERLEDTVTLRDHLDLSERVKTQARDVEGLKSKANRLIGGLAVAIFLAGSALEIAIRHYLH